jgi:DeoR/GlpR family transcriptional regulator of sugar metabolism
VCSAAQRGGVLLSIQRREEIKRIILEKKNISVAEIARHFQVSTETVRRDFDYLESSGFIEKSYGGATLKMRMAHSVPQEMRSVILVDVKRRMVKKAAEFLNPNDSIFLDHSTTVFEMCREIEHIPLTVMTNSLYVMNYFSRNPLIRLVIPGGNLDLNTQGFFGMEMLDFIERHYLDKVFFSCRALSMRQGLCDSDEQIAALRKTIINRAEQVYLLADHTKIGKPSFINIAGFEKIDYLITDEKPGHDWVEFLTEQNVHIVECAPAETT